MPDYGSEKGFSGRQTNTYKGGSGYVSGSGGSGKKQTVAQKNREKKRKAALAAQLKAQREGYERQQEIDAAKAISSLGMTGAAQAAAQSPKATQVGYSPSQAIDRTPVNKSAFEKIKDDFLMDMGFKNKDADYYRRLDDRSDAAKKEQERLKEKRDRDRDRARSTTTTPTTTTTTPTTTTPTTTTPTTLPPEIVDPFRPISPQYPGMYGGLGAFGYSPALMQFESQQGAGQVPYYMAAARNAQTPNMSPAFMHAARNYDILGGMQRTMPRPIEMMGAAERAQIAGMSNFSTPNYNSPYDQFNFFSNMVSGGMPTQVPTGPSGKGARPSGVGLGALLASGMFG